MKKKTTASFLTARTLILHALTGGPAYGLELAERVRVTAGVKIGPGQLYPELHALKAQRLVYTSDLVPGDRGGRSRILYKLTAAGEREIDAQRAAAGRVFGWLR